MTHPTKHLWLNFYDSWELYWPSNVTWQELHGAANDD